MADKKLRFEVEADTTDASKDLASIVKVTEQIEGETVTFKTEAQVDQALASIKALRDHLESLSKVRPDLDVSGAVAGLDRLEAKARDTGVALRNVGDAARQGSGQAFSSVGPLRDVAGGLGAVNTGALDAAESLLGVGETIGMLSPRLSGLGAALGKAGFIGATVATAVIGIKALFDAASAGVREAGETLRAELEKIRNETKIEPDIDLTALTKAIRDLAGDDNARKILSQGQLWDDLGRAISGTGDDYRAFADAALTAAVETGGSWTDLAPKIFNAREAVKSVREEQADATETARVHAEVLRDLGLATDETGAAQMRHNESLRGYEDGLGGVNRGVLEYAALQAEAARATGEHAHNVDTLREALDAANEQAATMAGATLSLAETRVAAVKAEQEFLALQKEGKASTDELVVSAQNLAEKYALQVEAQKLANGESFTTTDRNAAIKASLQATADQASGPTKKAIEDVVAALDKIPPEVSSDVTVNNAEALRKLNEQIRLMQIIRDTSTATVAALRAVPGGAGGAILGQSAVAPITQNITVNAGFGTDAFAVRSAVLSSARQAARLTQNAVKFRR